MDPQLAFTLVLSGLHLATLLAVWGVFAWLFVRSVAPARQVAGGKAPDPKLLSAATRETLVGQLAFALLVYFVVYPAWRAMGGRMDAPLDPLQLAWHLPVFILANDTIFYWSHRGLHTRWWFQRVHARHHRFRYVRGPVAEYAHPLENAANFVAFFAGPVLLGSPLQASRSGSWCASSRPSRRTAATPSRTARAATPSTTSTPPRAATAASSAGGTA